MKKKKPIIIENDNYNNDDNIGNYYKDYTKT